MKDIMLQRVVDSAVALGPTVLVRGMQVRRPNDVVKAPSLSIDDKRTILAAWASDFYAVESKPTLRQLAQSAGSNYCGSTAGRGTNTWTRNH